MNPAHRLLNFFTSLRLTVVCLVLALGLVFIGTLAQVHAGLYAVQEGYFHSLFVWWSPKSGSWKIPIWPGGYLLGTVLLVNLIAAHIKRFEIKRKKIGIFIIHAGLIFLLLGQLMTELFQVESFMRIPEGASKNYSESGRHSELAIIDHGDPKEDYVVSIPEKVLGKHSEIGTPALPFKVKVESFYPNSVPHTNTGPQREITLVQAPLVTAMDDRNMATATIEIETDEGKKGPFTPSMYLEAPKFTYKGHEYELAMRPVRYYKPYYLHLIDFTHEIYPGTERLEDGGIPKNFASRVQVIRPDTGENREVQIYMNNPLRYGGETYYQGSFEPGDTVTILQVVRNPSWLTPYIACAMVGAGLLIQFLSHLVSFTRKRSA
jgi:hypothetical protein